MDEFDVLGECTMSVHELYACVSLREFSAQAALRLRPELQAKPVAILDGEPPLQEVCSINAAAASVGVSRGMTRLELDSMPSVIVLVRSAAEERVARDVLRECAGSFTPRIEEHATGNHMLCVLDIAGTEKLFGAPLLLVNHLLERLKILGFHGKIATSSNFHAAIALACGSTKTVCVVAPGEQSSELIHIPVSVLDCTAEQRQTLIDWGIRRLGELAALPEDNLVARIGQDGRRLHQLARGVYPHLFVPIEIRPRLQEILTFDVPVESLDSLLFMISAMLEQLIQRATHNLVALAAIRIVFKLDDKTSYARTLRPALPTNERMLWLKLAQLDLGSHPPNAGILSIRLAAETGATSKVQLGLFSPQLPESGRLDVTLARIRSIVGEQCAGSPALLDTHRTDRFRIQPFKLFAKASHSTPQAAPVAERMLRPAEIIHVTAQEQRPCSFYFRAAKYEIEAAYGPWRIDGEWWSSDVWSLEQWDVMARAHDGAQLWCCLGYQRAARQWQMVSLYD